MWKRITAKTEGVYIADTEQFVTKKMDKLRAEYGGFPGDLHFGLTKRPARVSRCMKEEQKFLTVDKFQSCPWRNVMTLRRRWGFLISFPNGSALTSQSAVFLH